MQQTPNNIETRRISAAELSRFFKGLASELKAVGSYVDCSMSEDSLNIFVEGGSLTLSFKAPEAQEGDAQ